MNYLGVICLLNWRIGAGAAKGVNGWTTLDLNNIFCDLHWNLEKGIPFPDDSVEIIYSSHVFEHFPISEVRVLLQESYRVLKPAGIFSICVPNARLFIQAYINKEKTFFTSKPQLHFVPESFNNTTAIDYLNYVAYMGNGHKYMYDEDNIVFLLIEAGFKDAKIREFDPAIDKVHRRDESLFAVCYK